MMGGGGGDGHCGPHKGFSYAAPKQFAVGIIWKIRSRTAAPKFYLTLFGPGIFLPFNPIWTGLFPNQKRRGGIPPPNLPISRQNTMKLGKDIFWVEIFTN